jgi:hypothetical protein
MKMKPEHYAQLCSALDSAPRIEPDTYAAAGLTMKRYRWDALYRAGLSKWICDELYPYLNDSHVDTALREYYAHPY